MYDYYAYPQLYGGSDGISDYVEDDREIEDDPSETFNNMDLFMVTRNSEKHVTYVSNGAVISNVPTELFARDTDVITSDTADYDDNQAVVEENNLQAGVSFHYRTVCM